MPWRKGPTEKPETLNLHLIISDLWFFCKAESLLTVGGFGEVLTEIGLERVEGCEVREG